MKEKKFFFRSGNLRLCGILTSHDIESSRCIIFCHGITVDKDESGIFTGLAHRLAGSGFNVFRFDFRGHGESEGLSTEMTVRGEISDLGAAVSFVREKGFSRLGILAASFGGGPATIFVHDNPKMFESFVLWNPVLDYRSCFLEPTLPWPKKNFGPSAKASLKEKGFVAVGSRKFRIGPALWDDMEKLLPWRSFLDIRIPMLIVHGDNDSYVPYGDSVKYSGMNSYSRLITIPGGEHGFHDDKRMSEQADKATVEFFLETMP